MIDPAADVEVVATGLNASPGAAPARSSSTPTGAEELGKAGEAVDPRPLGDDARRHPRPAPGAGRAHRARRHDVARGRGRPRAWASRASPAARGSRSTSPPGRPPSTATSSREGDLLTIDGGTGRVMLGEVPLVPPQINEDFETILGWADGLRRLRVRANADTPEDAAKAREFGARGHRPLPHRAHVHGRGPAARRCAR